MPVKLGKAFRVAPGRRNIPLTFNWKFWTNGSDVYATVGRLDAHFSVHASGLIHYRIGRRDKQQLAPPLALGSGKWLHAFEVRFLLSSDALSPTYPRKLKNPISVVDTPPDHILILNLLVGAEKETGTSLPIELLPAHPVWRAVLGDSRPVVLIARVGPLDEANANSIALYRKEMAVKATFTKPPSTPYMEVQHLHWDPKGGNVVLVVPMGQESVRVEPVVPSHPTSPTRSLRVRSPDAATDIPAPDGSIVGRLSLQGIDATVSLRLDVPQEVHLGVLTLTVIQGTLRQGERFTTPTFRLSSVPTVDGRSPREWFYHVSYTFDGMALRAIIRPSSCGLRSAGPAAEMPSLASDEEVIFVAPTGGELTLLVTPPLTTASLPLTGRLTLRSIVAPGQPPQPPSAT